MISIAIIGFSGKMGKEVFQLIQNDPLLTCINTKKHSHEEIDYLTDNANVIIDFSNSAMLPTLLKAALKTKTPIVCGTTGYSLEKIEMIKKAGEEIPILYSSNFSIGIALCHLLLEKITPIFGEIADIDIVESHHRQKKDAPSGTALSLKENIKRHLPQKEISIHSIRSGSIIGEHNLIFNTNEEQITLSHKALTRKCFAKGSLLGAKFIHNKKSGLYTIYDIFSHMQKVQT